MTWTRQRWVLLSVALAVGGVLLCPVAADDDRERAVVPLGLLRGGLVGTAGGTFGPADGARHEGYEVAKLRYNVPAGKYAHRQIARALPLVPDTFTLTVKGNGDAGLLIHVRVTDADGETFNVWPEGRVTVGHEGWRTFSWKDGYRDSWGPKKNSKVDGPIRSVDLFLMPASDKGCKGEIAFTTLVMEGPAAGKSKKLSFRSNRPLPIEIRSRVETAAPAVVRVDLANRGEEPITGTLVVAESPQGHSLAPKPPAVPSLSPGDTWSVRFLLTGAKLNPYNRYRFVLRFEGEGGQSSETFWIDGPRSKGVNLGELRDSTTVPASPFGIGTHFCQGFDWRRSIPMLQAVGVKWVRDSLRLQRKEGKWELEEDSRLCLKALKEAGINLCCYMYGPYEPDEYAEMMRYVVREVGDQVKVWEIWNEPHNFGFMQEFGGKWNGLDDSPWVGKYVELAVAAGRAIHEEDPEAIVIAGDDVPPNNVQFMQLGMGESIDGVTHHPYNYSGLPPESTIWGPPEQVKRDNGIVVADPDCTYESLIRHTRRWAPGKQIWITEYGYLSPAVFKHDPDNMYQSISETVEAKYFARWYLLNFALGVDGFLMHTFQSDDTGFGIVRDDFTPTEAYYAIGRICGLFDSTWKLTDDVKVEFGAKGQPLPKYGDALHGDAGSGYMNVPIKGGIHLYAWKQPERGELAIAFWHASWPNELRPPIGRTLRIRAPGYGHAIRIDTLSGEHPDFRPTRIEDDGTMVFENVAVPDYPIVVKMFAAEKTSSHAEED